METQYIIDAGRR